MTRAGGGEQVPTLEGYAAVFNRETVLVPKDAWYEGSPEVREKINIGAFKRSIGISDQRAVWNHNTDIVLGRRKNGTLTLTEDEKGLRTIITPPDTDLVRDMVLAPIDRGDVDQMSFGFRVIDDSVTEERGLIMITLREVDLIEVSPVAIPAYTDTEIALSARSADRIEEFRSKYSKDPAQHIHAEQSDPADMRHADEALRLERERLLEEDLVST
jgi:HK97 family phage prohead protease